MPANFAHALRAATGSVMEHGTINGRGGGARERSTTGLDNTWGECITTIRTVIWEIFVLKIIPT